MNTEVRKILEHELTLAEEQLNYEKNRLVERLEVIKSQELVIEALLSKINGIKEALVDY